MAGKHTSSHREPEQASLFPGPAEKTERKSGEIPPFDAWDAACTIPDPTWRDPVRDWLSEMLEGLT